MHDARENGLLKTINPSVMTQETGCDASIVTSGDCSHPRMGTCNVSDTQQTDFHYQEFCRLGNVYIFIVYN